MLKFVFIYIVCFCFIESSNAQTKPLSAQDSLIIKTYFFRGLTDRINKKIDSAEQNFKQILKIDSLNSATNYELAMLYLKQSKILEAEHAIKNALKEEPTNKWYLLLLSDIYKQTKRMNLYAQQLYLLIKIEPENSLYYFEKANTNLFLGKYKDTETIIQLILEKFGKSADLDRITRNLKLISNKNSAFNELNQLLNNRPESAEEYLKIATQLKSENKLKESLLFLKNAEQIEQNNYKIQLALAEVYNELKQVKEALQHLNLALNNEAMPLSLKLQTVHKIQNNSLFSTQEIQKIIESINAQYQQDENIALFYGDLLYQQKKYHLAKTEYQRALTINNQSYVAWEKLLAIEILLNQFENAIKTGEEAVSLFPNQVILHYYFAFALHQNKQTAAAAMEIKTLLSLDVAEDKLKSMTFALQAEILIDQGKFKEAENSFEKALEIEQNNYLMMSNYAYFLLLRNHNLEKAEKLASIALKALPNNAAIIDTYAMVLFKQDKFKEALHQIEKLVQNKTQHNTVYLEHYGDILFKNNRKEEAILAWQKSKDSGNNSEKLTRKINEKKYIK